MAKMTHDTYVAKCVAKHGTDFTILSQYTHSHDRILVRCEKCQTEKYKKACMHLHRPACYICTSLESRSNLEDFIKKGISLHGDKFEYYGPYVTSEVKIKMRCKKCNTIFHQAPHVHLKGHGCFICSNRAKSELNKTSIEDFEKRARKIHKKRYKYFQDYKGIDKRIKILCKQCKLIFATDAGSHLHGGNGCTRCIASKGARKIEDFLIVNNTNYQREHGFIKCRSKRMLKFDFYLPDLNLCIEYDGIQHFHPIAKWGGRKNLVDIRKRDQIKNDYCKNNGIRLIRIPYTEYKNIDRILAEQLIL